MERAKRKLYRYIRKENNKTGENGTVCRGKANVDVASRPLLSSTPFHHDTTIPFDKVPTRLRARFEFQRGLLDVNPSLAAYWPVMGRAPIDLFSLYNMVMDEGGYEAFHAAKKWQNYCREHHTPRTCTSSGSHLSQVYRKYLQPIEDMYNNFVSENAKDKLVAVVPRTFGIVYRETLGASLQSPASGEKKIFVHVRGPEKLAAGPSECGEVSREQIGGGVASSSSSNSSAGSDDCVKSDNGKSSASETSTTSGSDTSTTSESETDQESESETRSSSESGTSSSDESSSDSDDEPEPFVYGPDRNNLIQTAGALAADVPVDSMTENEVEHFPAYANRILRGNYLDARNHVLLLWASNIHERLPLLSTLKGIPELSIPLVAQVYDYLETKGLINVGCFETQFSEEEKEEKTSDFLKKVENPNCDKKIIVVGAGIAGLTVARQLTFFGYKNVQVYEARNRIGGRVLTLNTFDRPVDLGAMITTGVIGNPCHLLARQLRLEEYVLRPSKTQSLYDVAGARIPKADDRKVDILFNHLLEHACKHRARYAAEEAEETQGRIRQVLSLQNGPRSKAVETSENGNSRTGSGEYAKSRSGRKRRKIDYSLFAEEDISGSENTVHDQESNRNEYPSSKCQGADGVATASANSTVAEMDISLDKALKKAAAELPSAMGKAAVSMNLKLLMEWNRANLEFGCAGELEKVSNTHWDQDDAHGFMGDHVLIHGGYGQLCDGLAKDLNINLSSPVKKVVYKGDGGSSPHVPIRCSMPQQKGQKGYDHASRLEIQLEDGKTINDVSAVVVAVPLGCLQQKEKFQFCPELPRRKRESIAKMGAGNLNKIVMQFAHCFWDPDDDMFGRVTECLPNDSGSKGETDPAREARGYAYMFASLPTENGKHPPVLISFMAGKASHDVEKVDSDADIVSSVLGVLRKMYGKEKVPMGTKPVHSVVTRWGTDPYSKGAYSYVSVGCSGDDYDIIADPAFDGTVYFAGEHTNRNHPTTCAGAMLSGLQAASLIASKFGRWKYDVVGALREDMLVDAFDGVQSSSDDSESEVSLDG